LRKTRILLTGAGAPGGPGIIKALQLNTSFDLYTCDADPFASGRFLGRPFIQIPKAGDDNFISFVLNFCIENRINAILPLVTSELCHFAKYKELFLEHEIHVIVSNYEDLYTANNKGALYQHLVHHNIHVPEFKTVTTIEELADAAQQLGYPELPVCIKPTLSNGSRGVRILQEEKSEFDLLFYFKPNHLYSTLDHISKILAEKKFPELLVSEYLPGMEFTIDAIVQKGVPKLILPRSRTKINSGISVKGTFIKHESIINYCDQILRTLNLSGPIGLQVKEDVSHQFQLLEINPRLQGSSVAALGIGINLPVLAIQQEYEPIDIDGNTIKWGTSFVRYYEELFYK
jgi:carbamoyl-phosphate synthase large subunit